MLPEPDARRECGSPEVGLFFGLAGMDVAAMADLEGENDQ